MLKLNNFLTQTAQHVKYICPCTRHKMAKYGTSTVLISYELGLCKKLIPLRLIKDGKSTCILNLQYTDIQILLHNCYENVPYTVHKKKPMQFSFNNTGTVPCQRNLVQEANSKEDLSHVIPVS